jgi:hypothetical protein
MTPRRNQRRLARELKHAPPVFDLDEESPWPLPEPIQHQPSHDMPHGQRPKEEPCKRPTTK